jgi:multiple sugar transport system permease protein
MTLGTGSPTTARNPQPLPPPVRAAYVAPPRRRAANLTGYLFLAPYLVLFSVFLLLPLAYGLWLSFMQYEMLSPEPPRFIGLANYREAFNDERFWRALWATIRFVGMTAPLTILLALSLALAISTIPDRRQHVYRLMVFLPTMITITVAGLVWRWLYNTEFGLLNAILNGIVLELGGEGFKGPWLTKPNWAMPSIVLMTLWWTVGGPLVILLAGIRQIPDAYYEAAALDGATGWRSTVYITLPMLKPVLLLAVVLNVIGAFQVFGQPFIMTQGGPERSTLVLMMYIYETSFNNYRLGYGAAMSWLLFVLIATFSVIQFRLMRER